MHVEHVGEENRQRQKHSQKTNDDSVHKVANVVGITGRSINDRTTLAGIVKVKTELLEFCVDFGADANQNMLRQGSGCDGCQIFQTGGRKSDDEDGTGQYGNCEQRAP